MSNEELLKMAKESGVTINGNVGVFDVHEIFKFAALVQAATAEECAKVCDNGTMGRDTPKDCAEVIRTKYQDNYPKPKR